MRLTILILALLCVSATPRPPRPKLPVNPKATQPPTSGSAALANIKALVAPPTILWTDTIAWSYGDADMDADDVAGVTNFTLYWGPASKTYTNHTLTGRVLTTTFVSLSTTNDYLVTNYLAVAALSTNGLSSIRGNEMRIPALPLTNFLLTVTTTGTNIQRRTSFRGAWTSLNTTRYTVTNPLAPIYFRGQGRTPNTASIYMTRF